MRPEVALWLRAYWSFNPLLPIQTGFFGNGFDSANHVFEQVRRRLMAS